MAEVDKNRRPVPGTEEYISCDTLLLSCGLIPENELSLDMGVALNPATSGPVVNESLETNIPGVFACGNVLHVHDLVDYVSEEAENAGKNAAVYVQGGKNKTGEESVAVRCGGGVRYTVPSIIHIAYMPEEQVIRFRVGNVYKNACLTVRFNDKVVMKMNKRVMAPGEMEQIKLKKNRLEEFEGLREITLSVQEEDS